LMMRPAVAIAPVAMVASGMTAQDDGNEPIVILSGDCLASGDLDFGL
jgi:hypothetical protein